MSFPINKQFVTAMRGVIEYFFLERQEIVALAMLEIAPPILTIRGLTHILGIEVEPYKHRWREWRATNPDWQLGVWRDEWEYFVHGLGCKLVHLETGEPIEWDASHLHAFDHYWFWNHLNWRIQRTAKPENVDIYTNWLRAIYEYMLDHDLIIRDGKNLKYILND